MTFTYLDDVLNEVEELSRLFADAGYRLFLVGGIVRDQWLDEPLIASSDIDLTTDALPAEIKRIVAPFAEDLWTQGEKFGTIGLRSSGRDFEITTHRAETYTSDSRKPIVSFGDVIDVDLSRRDFTVNAMAIELPDGDLVDPYGGAHDLSARLLRTPLSADVSFTDDPLRMLRAARFATKFSLVPDEELIDSATRLHTRLRIVAIERIGVELRRLLSLEAANIGLRFLADTGSLAEVLSYGQPALIDVVNPALDAAIDVANRLPADWHQRLAAIGISVFTTVDGVQAMCDRLRLARDDERRIVRMSRSAIEVLQAMTVDDETVRRWVDGCEDRSSALSLAAVFADDPSRVAAFDHAVHDLIDREDPDAVTFLGGETIMSVLDMPPGPAIGHAQKFLKDCYFAHGPLDAEDQQARLASWWADHPTA